MERLTFTSATGEVVHFGGPPFYLQKVDGLGDVEAEIQLQKSPFQDGSTLTDSILNERMISIEFLIVQDDGYHNVSASRVQIAKAFNPKLGLGILRYENDHVVREIKAIADSVPIYPNGPRTETIQKGLINLICPSPFWEDIAPENYKLEDFVGNFRFPFKFPVRFASRGDSRELVNKGDVPTPIKVTFRGESINPKITNLTTGEFIKVNRSIPPNYSLVINTEFGNKEVKIVALDGVEQNAFHYIDLESSFFMLNVGENRFSFITDGGQPEVYVEYRNKYLGV